MIKEKIIVTPLILWLSDVAALSIIGLALIKIFFIMILLTLSTGCATTQEDSLPEGHLLFIDDNKDLTRKSPTIKDYKKNDEQC